MKIDPATLAVIGVIFASLLALLGVLIGQLWARLAALEARVEAATSYNRRLWLWARKHIDLYYRWRKDGSPEPDPLPDDPYGE